jgi:hypothetical protein
MKDHRSLPLKNAPLQYAPQGEMGVVYLFANIAKKLQFRIEEIRAAYPDCIAYRQVGDHEKRVKIEFEYRSSNFNCIAIIRNYATASCAGITIGTMLPGASK